MYRLFIIAVFFIVPSVHAITLEQPLENPYEEARATALFHEIRCMVCAGESIADSRAKLATDLRHFVREKIKKGASDQAIMQALTQAYGDEILMRPPVQENTLVLWIGPLVIVSISLFFLWRLMKR